jgi:glycosyltransferase involved in cell wall biosynthesis
MRAMRVLHYYNWGYFEPIASGADVIASNQLAYCRRRGWDVDVLLMGHRSRAHQADAFRRRYSWVRSVQVVEPPWCPTFQGQLGMHSYIARSETFLRLAREGHDLLLTNYVFSAPLLQAMPGRCIKLVESHDIMTHAFALYERIEDPERDPMAPARDHFSWLVERELYSLFDGVMFINEQEAQFAGPSHPGRIHAIPPMMPWESADGPGAESDDEAPVIPNRPADGGFELLFVGSEARPNVRGLGLFYRHVFLPYLRKRRVRMGVIGRVCEHLDFDDWYVAKLGVVPGDLRDYYGRAKVVIIPLLEGSGLSIKTIECLAHGRAVATTRVGARGLRDDPDAFLIIDPLDDPHGSAEAILELLASDARRMQMQRTAKAHYRASFGRERYFDAMDRVMESLGIAS